MLLSLHHNDISAKRQTVWSVWIYMILSAKDELLSQSLISGPLRLRKRLRIDWEKNQIK